MNAEEKRLEESASRQVHWERWGPYLSERQWGTVREDYSANGDAWNYFTHDHSRSRAYRWGEDGIAGICDRHQHICFALAFWNEKDPILKERLFGLTNREGNHGEDVKEYYYYLDATPTSSYLKYLYKYPHAAYPYARLRAENAKRTRSDPEYELVDTGIFAESRYFDVFIEYAKGSSEDVLIRITAWNRGPEPARLRLLPTIWFRNRWDWGDPYDMPYVRRINSAAGMSLFELSDYHYGQRFLAIEGTPELLFTENETHCEALYQQPSKTPYVKDAFHRYIIDKERAAINPAMTGTKAAAHFSSEIAPGKDWTVRLRFVDHDPRKSSEDTGKLFGAAFHQIFDDRQKEADEFYATRMSGANADEKLVHRQAFAGLIWNKQSYHYDVRRWLNGDPTQPKPDPARLSGRNHDWIYLYNSDVVSMPDKWEYPWYAAWDLGFHCVAMALIDPEFAKQQLVLFLREWYMSPSGQLPAYEWNFSDVNPPVHAWAAWRVYRIAARITGQPDRKFLVKVFHKLLLNFTWWLNRKDPQGMNVFQGGFLGLDNIGVFDRSSPLGPNEFMEQSDGTSWMAMYCLDMLAIAVELAREDPAYEDVASKFFEHFVHISEAMNNLGGQGIGLWNEDDGFYYDVLHTGDSRHIPLKVRSMVGLIPLFAVETFEPEDLERLGQFRKRAQWFLDHNPGVANHVIRTETSPGVPDHVIRRENSPGAADRVGQTQKSSGAADGPSPTEKSSGGERWLLTIANREKLERIYRYVFDENEFLSPHGIRSLSKVHQQHPYTLDFDGRHSVDYEPAESTTDLFGGNSNWRGPIWFPLNFLLIESMQRIHFYYRDDFKVEVPTGSGKQLNLWDASSELSRRLSRIFLRDGDRRPVYGEQETFQKDPYWRDLICFYEYFHGETGAGLGASHQTGWTALVAKLLEQSGD